MLAFSGLFALVNCFIKQNTFFCESYVHLSLCSLLVKTLENSLVDKLYSNFCLT